MGRGSLSIGKIYGISINLHYSWFLIVALMAWSLAIGYFPAQIPGKNEALYWLMGVLAALLLFASVLLHELSHSIVAIKNRIKVESITLFFFGGVAQVHEDGFNAAKELKVAIAGPLASFALALIFFLVSKVSMAYVSSVLAYVAGINLVLGIFNLIPGFPLDGGRVFRAILWWKLKDLNKATYYAAQAGKVCAVLLIITGVMGYFAGRIDLWYILLGLFLYSVANSSYSQTVLGSILKKVKVKDIMMKKFRTLDAGSSVLKADFKKVISSDQWIYPVKAGRKIIGVVSQEAIEKAKVSGRKAKIGDIATPIAKVKSVTPDDDCMKAYELMAMQGMEILPVMGKGKAIGIVKAATISEILSIENAKKRK
ncbi:MAG TPA: site-2 protease family protein [Nanoarchaeota archaeon]|nr:site-2 protease family protein [Nanoarchaeota archaeon]